MIIKSQKLLLSKRTDEAKVQLKIRLCMTQRKLLRQLSKLILPLNQC